MEYGTSYIAPGTPAGRPETDDFRHSEADVTILHSGQTVFSPLT